jgi:hypothetical protein
MTHNYLSYLRFIKKIFKLVQGIFTLIILKLNILIIQIAPHYI